MLRTSRVVLDNACENAKHGPSTASLRHVKTQLSAGANYGREGKSSCKTICYDYIRTPSIYLSRQVGMSIAHFYPCSHDGSYLLAIARPPLSSASSAQGSLGDRTRPSRSRFRMPRPSQHVNSFGLEIEIMLAFQLKNDSRSMIVVCWTSWPGNMPHVTAFRASSDTFVLHSP